jgi:hypothetical protein
MEEGMSRTNEDTVQVVPDLVVPEPARAPHVAMPFEDEDEPPPVHLELDGAFRGVPKIEAQIVTCDRCGAPNPVHVQRCAYCAKPQATRTLAPSSPTVTAAPSSYAPPPPVPASIASVPVTRADRFLEAFSAVPYDFWKRVAFYPFLALVLGNGCTCRGLSATTNVALVLLVVVGVLGVIACVRDQRSW